MKKLQAAFFVLCLLTTIAEGQLLWLARIGWSGLIILFVIDVRYALFAAGFYMSHFETAGFLANPIFTLKHFQIALILTAGITIVRDGLKALPLPTIPQIKFISPLAIIMAISLLSGWIAKIQLSDYLFTINIFSLIAATLFLAAFLQKSPDCIIPFLSFFVLGTALQIAGGVIDLILNKPVFAVNLLHDNHRGILCGMTLFYSFALLLRSRGKLQIASFLLTTSLIGTGLLLSCSRTAWISFGVSAICFTLWSMALPKKNYHQVIRWGVIFLLIGVLATLIAMASCDTLAERITHLPQLVDINYLKYTIEDKQNFGFLGIYRLNQLREFYKVFIEHPVIGIGFAKFVTDYHGLFFAIISATGIIGSASFLVFIFNVFKKLYGALKSHDDFSDKIMVIAAATSFFFWLFTSIMETIIVHFFVWTTVTFCILMKSRNLSNTAKNED